MLTSATEHYRRQQRITALAVREGRRRASRGARYVAAGVGAYQLAAASLAAEFTPAQLAEQNIDAPPAGSFIAASVLTSRPALVGMLEAAASTAALDRLIATLVTDSARTAMSVEVGQRRNLVGYVRALNPPSCGRCAVLAGRVYRYSSGFQRHPGCDCLMTPVASMTSDLVTDPTQAFENGQIRGLSKSDADAINDGADIGQVVNVRRKAAGLTEGSSVLVRGGKPTPTGIYRVASDRTQAISLLKRYGYIT